MSSKTNVTWAEQYITDHANDPLYIHAGIMIEISEAVAGYMEDYSISRVELARRMGCSKAYITKLLRGSSNYTLETLIKLSLALGMKLRVELVDEKEPAAHRGSKYSYEHEVKKVAEDDFRQK